MDVFLDVAWLYRGCIHPFVKNPASRLISRDSASNWIFHVVQVVHTKVLIGSYNELHSACNHQK